MAATLLTRSPSKGYKGLGMEGALARWYARNTGKSLGQFRLEARALAEPLAKGAGILEVAPGPGYLAIELAKLGRFRVVGLDISKTFVELAGENARKAGVEIAFHQGNAAAMPFEADSFDLVVCRAAFKNFSEPVRSLTEMHRVLKSGGRALIIDLRKDAAPEDIAAAVDGMKLSRLNALLTRLVFRHMLLGRAHSKDSFRKMAAQTPFETCSFREELISLEVTFVKTSHDRGLAGFDAVPYSGNSRTIHVLGLDPCPRALAVSGLARSWRSSPRVLSFLGWESTFIAL